MEDKRKIGSCYEKRATEYLMQKGYSVRECNYHSPVGEIDIIAETGEYLCFVEVKYRTTNSFGSPLEAVDKRKQNRIRRVAKFYLMKHGLNEWTPCRFDVIAFEGERVTHIENAF